MLKDTKGNEGRRGLTDAKKMRESMDGDIVEMEGIVLLNQIAGFALPVSIPYPLHNSYFLVMTFTHISLGKKKSQSEEEKVYKLPNYHHHIY